MNAMDMIKVILIIQAFFSIGITLISHVAVDYGLVVPGQLDIYVEKSGTGDINENMAKVSDSLNQQSNIPLLDVGALVFYSGQIVLDLLVNFLYALPLMVGLLVYIITNLFGVNAAIIALVEGSVMVLMTTLYVIGIIELLLNLRSGGRVLE